jgi:hypothetical protein
VADLSVAEVWIEVEASFAKVGPEAALAGRLGYFLGAAMALRLLRLYAGLDKLLGPRRYPPRPS